MPFVSASTSPAGKNLSGPRYVAAVLALALLYVAASKLGFTMAFAAEQITVVWPPTGISLAALVLLGPRLWPGVALGALLTNITADEPVFTAAAIAFGNTMEALLGAWMLRRLDFNPSLARLRDIRSLLAAALAATPVAAFIGVASLCLGGVQPWQNYPSLWRLWWVGDATGAILVTPVLLAWASSAPFAWTRPRAAEGAALLTGLLAACTWIFIDPLGMGAHGRAFLYLIFPFVIWAAMRFGQRGSSTAILLASSMAIWATAHNLGPFMGPVEQNLAALQIFMASAAAIGLFLAAAVGERKRVEEILRETDRRKDEFLSILAHELRNPLAPLTNVLHIVQMPGLGAERQAEACGIMRRQLQHMGRLIDDLVDVGRISHGKVELRRGPLLLAEALQAAAEAVGPLMEAHKHDFSLRLPPEPVWLHADSTRVTQIFINLLNNAAKYTPPGGTIALEAALEGETVVVRVRDSGLGIPPELLEKVFGMFVQVESGMERRQGGLGIGLMLVKSFVEMHGGSVEARSEGAGKGAEFVVRLPRISAPAMAPVVKASRPQEASASARKFRILAVDDNEPFIKTFGYMLEVLGHEVRLALDGPSALNIAEAFQPEVVLLDVGLPGMNGYEVCKKMRGLPALKHAVFIAQTGWNQPEHRERSKAAGFDQHVVKPITIGFVEDLLASLDQKAAA